MVRSALLALAFVCAALAGCSGGGAAADVPADFSELELQATPDTGVIRGVVVDETITPVADAVVRLLADGREAASTQDGLFGFDGLAPGTYFLQVSHDRFHTVQASGDVVAGDSQPPIMRVLLQAKQFTQPFHVQLAYNGYISCSYKLANIVFDASYCDPTGLAGYADDDDANPFFPLDGVPDYYQTEIVWESTQPFGDELVTIQLACDEADCSETSEEGDANRLCNVRGTSPLVCRVNQTEGGGGGGVGILEAKLGGNRSGFTVGVYANCDPCIPGTILGFGLVLEQRFDVIATVFYGYRPPADWLFVESNTVPGPP